jgi:hypothetical protein
MFPPAFADMIDVSSLRNSFARDRPSQKSQQNHSLAIPSEAKGASDVRNPEHAAVPWVRIADP